MDCTQIPKRISKEESIQRIIAGIKVSREEAEEIYNYDQLVEKDETVGNLSMEKEKVVKAMRSTGTRIQTDKPTKPRNHKPNATKRAIISSLLELLQNTDNFSTDNIEVVNPERIIKFSSGGESYELVLTKNRKPKKVGG